MKYNSIGEMFFAKRDVSPKDTAYTYKESGEWKSLTYEEVISESEKIAASETKSISLNPNFLFLL